MVTDYWKQPQDSDGRPLGGDRAGQGVNLFTTAEDTEEATVPFGFIGLPVPAARADFDDDDDDDLVRPAPVFPFTPRNAYFLERRAMFDASVDIAEATDRQAEAQEATNVVLGEVKDALPNAADLGDAIGKAIGTSIADAMKPIADQLGVIARGVSANAGEIDNAILILILGFDSDGQVFGGTPIGKLLLAGEIRDIQRLVELGADSAKAKRAREQAIEILIKYGAALPWPDHPLDERDVRRLIALAPLIRDAMARLTAPPDAPTVG